MAVLKCKMCGGDLNITEGMSVCECEYCGSKQTVPSIDDEKKSKLYERANKLRFACDFDKAATVYESIISEYSDEAEAFWGLVLCEYGIEYVDDPATGKKVPTCHRSSFESVMKDENFNQVMECSDSISRAVYREEAKAIEEIRKGILDVSEKEAPYDIFICYKETDESGSRTIDSVMAQEVYDALTEKGYRVFFSRISLENKLGVEYEPYIFAALNSAKIMLAFGTDYEYYNAVWVKNEWSRYLKLMTKDKQKRLIPCYKNLDAYDIPEQFQHLQAQDMGKVGAIQDLLRGIDKILGKDNTEVITVSKSATETEEGGKLEAALKRGWMAIEDEEWEQAESFFETALNINAECANAYLGKTCASFEISNPEEIGKHDYHNSKHFQKFIRFANDQEKEILSKIEEEENKERERVRQEQERKREEQERMERVRQEQERMERVHEEQEQKRVHEFIKESQTIKRVISSSRSSSFGIDLRGRVFVCGDNKNGVYDVSNWTNIVEIVSDYDTVVGIKADRSVVASGENGHGQCNVSGWTDIIDIAAGSKYSVGLKADGSVVATGHNDYGQCNVSTWKDIVAIAVGYSHTVGLKSDGTVVATGHNKYYGQCNVSAWKDIVAIVAGSFQTFGMKSDGTVVAAGNNDYGQCNVSAWKDIVSIAAGVDHTVGLKSDGTVVATGNNKDGQCNVSAWKDIVTIAAGVDHTVGLKSDGTVVATGNNKDGKCNVSSWKDIVAIVVNSDRTVGLQSNGTMIMNKNNSYLLFDDYEKYYEWRKEVERKKNELIEKRKEERIKQLLSEQTELQNDLANLKGIFSGKRKKEIENQLQAIQTELASKNQTQR